MKIEWVREILEEASLHGESLDRIVVTPDGWAELCADIKALNIPMIEENTDLGGAKAVLYGLPVVIGVGDYITSECDLVDNIDESGE